MFIFDIAAIFTITFPSWQVWWAIGSMFGALLAYGVMRPGGLGWHWYLGLAAIPLALVLFFFPVCTLHLRHYCTVLCIHCMYMHMYAMIAHACTV